MPLKCINRCLVDHGSEWTGFHGDSLNGQARFLLESIDVILQLYQQQREIKAPKCVTVVGHSMGGVVARLAMSLPQFKPGTIKDLITIYAPHASPVVSIDAKHVFAYRYMNNFWNHGPNSALDDVALYQLMPTARDRQVTRINAALNNTFGTFAALGVDLGKLAICPDHNSVLRCRQALLVISKIIRHVAMHTENPTKRIESTKGLIDDYSRERLRADLNLTAVDEIRGNRTLALWYEKIDYPLVKSTVLESPFAVGPIYGISTTIGFPERRPYEIVHFPNMRCGWRGYHLKIASLKSCGHVIVHVVHLKSTEEYWYHGKCDMLLRFGNGDAGVRIEFWMQPKDPPLKFELSFSIGISRGELFLRQFQRLVSVQLVFWMLVGYEIWSNDFNCGDSKTLG